MLLPIWAERALHGSSYSLIKTGIILQIIQLKNFIHNTNNKFMGNLLYLIAVILVIAWAIGFFALHAGGIIHILLVIAVVSILFKAIGRAA